MQFVVVPCYMPGRGPRVWTRTQVYGNKRPAWTRVSAGNLAAVTLTTVKQATGHVWSPPITAVISRNDYNIAYRSEATPYPVLSKLEKALKASDRDRAKIQDYPYK